MPKVKIKVATRLVGLYEVVNDYNESPAESADVKEITKVVSVIQIAHDIGGDGCWYVHEEPGAWWGFATRPCTPDPVFRIRLKESGHITEVAYKVADSTWVPLRKISPPSGVAIEIELEICDGNRPPAAPCRYVVVAGRPYRVC